MKISVVMATYNGEKYISKQMDSIISQSRQVDELIILDDCSTDNTVSIIESYASKHQYISFERNTKNLGWKKNFYNAIKKANGDLIVLSDQDDIWYEDKIRTIENIFLLQPEIELLASEYDEIIRGIEIKRKSRKEETKQMLLDERLIHTYYPGCTYAFRATLFRKIETMWDTDLAHDAQLSIASKIYGTMYVYNKPLILYRKHDSNATKRTVPSIEKKRQFIETEKKCIEFVKRVKEDTSFTDSSRIDKIVYSIEQYHHNRVQLMNNGTIGNMFVAIRKINCYYSPRTCIGDIVLSLKG